MKATTKKWNLDRDVKLNHRVVEAVWQEEEGHYTITVENEGRRFQTTADVLISCQGVLNKWKWPNIEGLETFKGHKCHSAAWDQDYDFSNKTIAVIGNGSSGVQIIPKLAELPGSQIIAVQRTPNWVYIPKGVATFLGNDQGQGNPTYTEEDIRRFQEDPEYHRTYRRKMIHSFNSAFPSVWRMHPNSYTMIANKESLQFLKNSEHNKKATELARKQMAERLNHDPELCAKMIPEWGVGCRRITPADGYLECLLKPNVQAVNSGVVKVTDDAIHTQDGRCFKVDAIVCATGFDVSLLPQWKMIGRHGVDLASQWTLDPESYLSLAARDMPNFFLILGPNAVVAHGSVVEAINWSTDYVLRWIRKIATEDIKSIVPKNKAVDEFMQYSDVLHKRLIWTDRCSSWFKRNTIDGRVTAAFAGTALLFRQLVSELRCEDFEVEYNESNRWLFLGNGFTATELDPSNDLSWYIEH